MNRESIIIPNAEILEVPNFFRKMKVNENHTMAIKEFSDTYGLGLHYDNFYGVHWQHAIVSLGHIYISIEDMVIVYLPEVMSLNQIMWFNENKEFFVKVRNNLALEVVDCDGKVIISEDIYTIQDNEDANTVFKLMYKAIKENAKQLKDKKAKR